jgi:L-seryl-tRNA(Ser) seleniumtransferase
VSVPYRQLPSVDALLHHPSVAGLAGSVTNTRLTSLARRVLGEARSAIAEGGTPPGHDALAAQVVHLTHAGQLRHLRQVINATGVVLQTNLGRSPLSAAALDAVRDVALGYSNLEFDVEAGERGSRQTAISSLIAEMTGAAAGFVVNNAAAAVLLALAALATAREVIVSRGELVEIGGGFRIPDVLAQGGARLVEVGTTNRTYASDYEAAITSTTAAILRVHPSNFVVQGFTHAPALVELAGVARRHGVLLLDDLGSGALLDTTRFGLAHEPTVQESLAAGAHVVCFSGDKLLGGPQAGIVAGAAEPLRAMSRHPLARAMRIDKMSVAALEVTLRQYLSGDAERAVPIWRMLAATREELEARAASWHSQLRAAGIPADVVPGSSTVGGGSLPGETLPTVLLALHPASATDFARALRLGQPAVLGRVQHDTVLLDPRTVFNGEEPALLAGVVAAWKAGHSS